MTTTLLERLRNECPQAWRAAYVVGRWVWVEFSTKPPMGFRWNHKRHVWQHNCGVRTTGAPYDPRNKYGVIRAVETEVEAA